MAISLVAYDKTRYCDAYRGAPHVFDKDGRCICGRKLTTGLRQQRDKLIASNVGCEVNDEGQHQWSMEAGECSACHLPVVRTEPDSEHVPFLPDRRVSSSSPRRAVLVPFGLSQ
jgi:hypothetical protein